MANETKRKAAAKTTTRARLGPDCPECSAATDIEWRECSMWTTEPDRALLRFACPSCGCLFEASYQLCSGYDVTDHGDHWEQILAQEKADREIAIRKEEGRIA